MAIFNGKLTGRMIGAIERESDIAEKLSDLPVPSRLLSETEFLALTGLGAGSLEELLQLEWIDCMRTAEAMLFNRRDVLRARKLARLCGDFEMDALPASIIVDLLDRMNELEAEVARLRGLL